MKDLIDSETSKKGNIVNFVNVFFTKLKQTPSTSHLNELIPLSKSETILTDGNTALGASSPA